MTTIFSDDFNRGNGSPGSNWTSEGGTWYIDTNAVGTADSGGVMLYYNSAPGTTDYGVEAKFSTVGAFCGVVVRRTGASTYYQLLWNGSNGFYFQRLLSGSWVQIGSTRTTTCSNGDIIRLEVSGTGSVTLKAFKNDVQLGADEVDSDGSQITAAGYAGLWNYNAAAIFDDFVLTSLASPPSTQDAYAVSDVSADSGWTTSTAGTYPSLYVAIDEATRSDTDYAQSPSGPVAGSAYVVRLGALSRPDVGDRILSTALRKQPTGGAQINATVALKQGGSTIQTFTHNDLTDSWTQYDDTVTNSIADWTTAFDVAITFTQV